MLFIERLFASKIRASLFVSLIVVGIFLLAGCAAKQVSPEIQAYDSRVMAQPTTFSVQIEKSEEVWSRAQQFIATLSSFRIQTATNYVIQTYMTESSWPKYGYSVTRTTNGDRATFVVQCFCTNMFSKDRATYNAHALAHYMVTGEVIDQRINR